MPCIVKKTRHRGRVALLFLLLSTFLLSLKAAPALACACGCGVFDVATSSMFPTGRGGTAFLEYDFMDQDQNWRGTSKALAADNSDKQIRTDLVTEGGQYMFNRDWGVTAQVPWWNRHFVTDNGGMIESFNHAAFGDARLRGIYTGFSPDMTTGATFGVKLPTGDSRYANFDRDTEIGTGSTDLLLGAFHMDSFAAKPAFSWFANLQLDAPVLTQRGYRPGAEADAVAGIYYSGWKLGAVKVAPVGQVIGAWRLSDSGPAADPANSGYKRVLLSPGLEFDLAHYRFNAETDFPVYQDMTGNQLVAPVLVKFVISRSF